MDFCFNLFLEYVLHLVLLLLLSFSFFLLLNQRVSHVFQLLSFQVEVNEILIFVLFLADNAYLGLTFDFFQSFSGNDVSTLPEGDEFVEAVIFKFSDRTADVVVAFGRGFVNDDLFLDQRYFFDVAKFSDVRVFGREFFVDEGGQYFFVVVDVSETADGKGLLEGIVGEVAEACSE